MVLAWNLLTLQPPGMFHLVEVANGTCKVFCATVSFASEFTNYCS